MSGAGGPTVVVVHLPAGGHVIPTLGLLAALARRGARVVSFTTPEFAPALAAAGSEVRDYGGLGMDHTSPPPSIPQTALALGQATEHLLPGLVARVAAERPDVVAHDSMAPWGRVTAHALGRPSVCLTSTFAVHARVRPPASMIARAARDAATGVPAVRRLAAISRRVERAYGTPLGPPIELFQNRRGARTLVFTAREFQPNPGAVRGDVHYVGPLGAVRAPGEEPALAGLEPDTPLVYVSLGTLFEGDPGFYRDAARALTRPGRAVVMATGRVDPARLDLPPGVLARAHVDQPAVLRRAELFVTHAGLGGVHEALAAGVPMLLAPRAADQPIVAARVARLGAGRVLRRTTPATIAAGARRVLGDPRHRAAAERLGAQLRAAADPDRAADLVLGATA